MGRRRSGGGRSSGGRGGVCGGNIIFDDSARVRWGLSDELKLY